jgi:general secretion pathway protein J
MRRAVAAPTVVPSASKSYAGGIDQAGFTLLELLVTLVVLGLLLATLSQGVRFGLQAQQIETGIVTGANDLEATVRVLRRLLAQAVPGDPSSQGQIPNGPVFTGTAHAVSFTTRLPDGVGAIATREADVSLLVAAGHHLALRWRPHYQRWIGQQPAPAMQTLLDGVDHLDVAFWQVTSSGGGSWISAWSAPDPPRLVRLRVVFSAGDPRHWPDIIAAPMQAFPRR